MGLEEFAPVARALLLMIYQNAYPDVVRENTYRRTSDSGPSEIGTQYYNRSLYKGGFQIIGFPLVPLISLQRTIKTPEVILSPMCSLLRGFAVGGHHMPVPLY